MPINTQRSNQKLVLVSMIFMLTTELNIGNIKLFDSKPKLKLQRVL